jgi:mRNA-degrading endonuclease toxin of MazEF toxin-antitoxin module
MKRGEVWWANFPGPCVANLDTIATIPRRLLVERLCTLSNARIREIERAIQRALGMRLPCAVR